MQCFLCCQQGQLQRHQMRKLIFINNSGISQPEVKIFQLSRRKPRIIWGLSTVWLLEHGMDVNSWDEMTDRERLEDSQAADKVGRSAWCCWSHWSDWRLVLTLWSSQDWAEQQTIPLTDLSSPPDLTSPVPSSSYNPSSRYFIASSAILLQAGGELCCHLVIKIDSLQLVQFLHGKLCEDNNRLDVSISRINTSRPVASSAPKVSIIVAYRRRRRRQWRVQCEQVQLLLQRWRQRERQIPSQW